MAASGKTIASIGNAIGYLFVLKRIVKIETRLLLRRAYVRYFNAIIFYVLPAVKCKPPATTEFMKSTNEIIV